VNGHAFVCAGPYTRTSYSRYASFSGLLNAKSIRAHARKCVGAAITRSPDTAAQFPAARIRSTISRVASPSLRHCCTKFCGMGCCAMWRAREMKQTDGLQNFILSTRESSRRLHSGHAFDCSGPNTLIVCCRCAAFSGLLNATCIAMVTCSSVEDTIIRSPHTAAHFPAACARSTISWVARPSFRHCCTKSSVLGCAIVECVWEKMKQDEDLQIYFAYSGIGEAGPSVPISLVR
jgi:hypothetical protein